MDQGRRTSTATMAANQLRLWFSSFAYVLLTGLRRIRGQFTMTFNGQFVICF